MRKTLDMEKLFEEDGSKIPGSLSLLWPPQKPLLNQEITQRALTSLQPPSSFSSSAISPVDSLINSNSVSLAGIRQPSSFTLANRLISNPKPLTRQSESEDSQYFSGTDTSLVYADSSGFSTASSYSNYSMLPANAAAAKAASLITRTLTQSPPSPPPLKPLSKLMNVANAAYQL